ncbi:uncharacterized protein LOC135153775 [Lytechinus pictus]|uniref:uncharacterized protein LOC135153775 n=1 Tax=Lytechinus pictus TaxID=7653 RepID=UPI0030BA1853
MGLVKFGSFVIFLFILVLHASECSTLNTSSLCTECSIPLRLKKCYGIRIAYYANTDATFQVLLLRSGDISPNPGPEGCDSSTTDTAQHNASSQHLRRKVYDRVLLHSLSHTKHWLDREVWETIISLDIARKKKKRTHRGRRSPEKCQLQLVTQHMCLATPPSLPSSPSPSLSSTPSSTNDVIERRLSMSMLNARSLRNKSDEFQDYVLEHNFDVVFICETWLTSSDDAVIANLLPQGYTFRHRCRANRRGGGLAILYHDGLTAAIRPSLHMKSVEMMSVTLSSTNNISIDVVMVYRPPGTRVAFSTFIEEFTVILEETSFRPAPLVITGDFNIHLDNLTLPNTKKFNELLSSYGLVQMVTSPTHERGHILDAFIIRSSDRDIFSGLRVIPGISDHSTVACFLNVAKPRPEVRQSVVRNIKAIDRVSFADDLKQSNIAGGSSLDVHIAVAQYNTSLINLMDKHAPAKLCKVKLRPQAPWYTQECTVEKQRRRLLEKKWRSSRLEIDLQLYQEQKRHVNYLIRQSKQSYYRKVIEDCGDDSRRLFQVANQLLNRKQSSPLPSLACDKSLADIFNNFFVDKVNSIQRSLSPDVSQRPCLTDEILEVFDPTTADEIKSLICTTPVKSSGLDPAPTKLLKECAPTVAPVIAAIVNMSLSCGEVPKALKLAHIHPLLKKPSLDCESLLSYRPISNLPYLSKVLERVAFSRLSDYLIENDLIDGRQSAYRPNHSVETLLVNLSNDILSELWFV